MKFYFAIFLAIISYPLWSQRPVPPQANVQVWFDDVLGVENSGLINGRHYKQKFIGSKTNPFYGNGEGVGTVLTNGQLYAATLLYDIHRDVLVVKHIGRSGIAWFVELDMGTVQQFTIGDHVFRPRNGAFYEVLFHSQDFQVEARRSKVEVLVKSLSEYAIQDEVYLLSGGRQSRISTLTKFKDLVESKEQKKKVVEFMRNQNLKKRKLTEENLVAMAAFVQSLRDKPQMK